MRGNTATCLIFSHSGAEISRTARPARSLRPHRPIRPDDPPLPPPLGDPDPVEVLEQRNQVLPRNPYHGPKFRGPVLLPRLHPGPERLRHPPQRLGRVEPVGLDLPHHTPTI